MSPYKRLVGVLGDESLLAYDNPKDLFEKRDEIWEKLAERTKTWTTADLMKAMLAVDIWCGEVKTHLEAEVDPQVQHMGIIASYQHPVAGDVKVVAPAVKMSATPPEIRRPAPLVGEHSREILKEFGFGADEVAEFMASGATAQPN
jgi:crotonobetainyl-CoA:carnitine CoA-transferase CaiB-like acyl-CoA transferase